MDKDRKRVAERILNLTLDIIYLLTGEDYIVVKTISDEEEGWSSTQIPITKTTSHLLKKERINEQKILELTNKIIELLTGEVPIRCQDIAIYLSVEEWEYLKGHKDLYRDIMAENPKSLTSLSEPSRKHISDGVSSPPHAHSCTEENDHVLQDCKIEELADIKCEVISEDEEMYLEDSQQCKLEDSPTYISTEGIEEDIYPGGYVEFPESPDKNHFDKNLEEHLLSSDFKEYNDNYNDIGQDNSLIAVHQNRDLSTHPNNKELSSDQSLNDLQEKVPPGGKIFTCFECGKNFKTKCSLCRHIQIHKNERPFLCSECGKSFIQRSHLVQHQKNHRGEKPFSCPECGKCFTQKSSLCGHRRIHTGEKPFSCLECSKSFNHKSDLVRHQRIHSGEKPYSCLQCGKSFTVKSHLVEHNKNHTGDKPYSCSECGKCFTQKAYLAKHELIHTRNNVF